MLIDISQELFSCNVFPGDPSPEGKQLLSVAKGDVCNLTFFSMCAHNGTHIDAPFHFLNDGKTVDEIGLEPFAGDCYVSRHEGDVTAPDAAAILQKARDFHADKRILSPEKRRLQKKQQRYLQTRASCFSAMKARPSDRRMHQWLFTRSCLARK